MMPCPSFRISGSQTFGLRDLPPQSLSASWIFKPLPRRTRRQSQRPSPSRLVLYYVSPKIEHGPFDLLLHEPRRRRSWLIFDVGQRMRLLLLSFAVIALATG